MTIFKNMTHKTNFRLVIPDMGAMDFEASLQSVTIPGLEIEPTQINVNQQTMGNLPGSAVRFDPLNVRILLDEELSAYTDIYKWMISIVDYAGNKSTAQDPGTVPKNISIHVLDNSKSSIILTWKFYGAWPSSIGGIDFEYTDDSNTAMTTDVVFMYKSFEIEKNGVTIRPKESGSGSGIKGMHPSFN